MGEALAIDSRIREKTQLPPVRVRVLRTLHELAAISEAWDNLVLGHAAPDGRLPMLSHAWVSSHLELRHPKNRPWFCLAAFAGDHLIGVLPLEERRITVLGKPVTSLHQLSDPHTPIADAIVARGWERLVLASFRETLDEIIPDWFGLELAKLDTASPFLSPPASEALAGTAAVKSPGGLATVCNTTVTWDEYFAQCSAHFRHHLRRYGRKLAKLGKVETEIIDGAGATADYLNQFAPLEAAGWKGRAGSAIAAERELTEFYRTLCARLHCRLALEWHFLKLNSTRIAGHLVVRSGLTLVLWKAGYDEAYRACSPGTLLIGEMLKRACDDPQIDRVHFVTERPWLESWRPVKQPYRDLYIYPKRPRSLLVGAWPKQARRHLRNIPGLKPALHTARRLLDR